MKYFSAMVVISVRMEISHLAALRRIAYHNGITVSDILRDIVAKYLESHKNTAL